MTSKFSFIKSLNAPENCIGEYYDKNSINSKWLWLCAMGLFDIYDQSKLKKDGNLLDSSFTTLLFHKAPKRYSFFVAALCPTFSRLCTAILFSRSSWPFWWDLISKGLHSCMFFTGLISPVYFRPWHTVIKERSLFRDLPCG